MMECGVLCVMVLERMRDVMWCAVCDCPRENV